LLVITGEVQKKGAVVNLIAHQIAPLTVSYTSSDHLGLQKR
jgi:hypothetical protein